MSVSVDGAAAVGGVMVEEEEDMLLIAVGLARVWSCVGVDGGG
jgi:hypothetical protein